MIRFACLTLAVAITCTDGTSYAQPASEPATQLVYIAKQQHDSRDVVRAPQSRIKLAELTGVKIVVGETNQYLVQIDSKDAALIERVRKLIEANGILEFRILADAKENAELVARAKLDKPVERPGFRWVAYDSDTFTPSVSHVTREREGRKELLVLMGQRDPSGTHVESIARSGDTLSGQLSPEGGRRLKALTQRYAFDRESGHAWHMGIIFDGRLLSAPRIVSTISDRFQISGLAGNESENLVSILQAGRLPVELQRQKDDGNEAP